MSSRMVFHSNRKEGVMSDTVDNLLEVKNLVTAFRLENGDWVRAVDGISFHVPKG